MFSRYFFLSCKHTRGNKLKPLLDFTSSTGAKLRVRLISVFCNVVWFLFLFKFFTGSEFGDYLSSFIYKKFQPSYHTRCDSFFIIVTVKVYLKNLVKGRVDGFFTTSSESITLLV